MIKLIAIITMLIDHIGHVFFPDMVILRIIGRIALPLFALELARGRRRTRSVEKYLIRLLLLAILSQFPYMLFFDSTDRFCAKKQATEIVACFTTGCG